MLVDNRKRAWTMIMRLPAAFETSVDAYDTGGWGGVNNFAELLDALLFTPSRNGKLRLMQEYFATTPDPERGWALAALTGELSFAEAKPSQVRDLAISRVDPELFGWAPDFVGDPAQTAALIWPEPPPRPGSARPRPRAGGGEAMSPANSDRAAAGGGGGGGRPGGAGGGGGG